MERYQANAQVLACGINYDNGHKFRSTAIIEFGIPYKIDQSEIEKYKDPEGKKEVINSFLETLSTRCSPQLLVSQT